MSKEKAKHNIKRAIDWLSHNGTVAIYPAVLLQDALKELEEEEHE